MISTLKFVETALTLDVFFYSSNGTQIIFLSFDKNVVDIDIALNIALDLYVKY